MPFDVTPFMQARSDQLNADNLIGGPITTQITGAKWGSEQQPVILALSGGHMPWKPCKTMIRLLAMANETTDAHQWVGRWVTLYRDGSVRAPDGTPNAGGVRMSGMSGLDRRRTYQLTEARGKKRAWTLDPITAPQQSGAPTADLDALLGDNDLTRDDVDRWLASVGKPTLADAPEKVPGLAVWLAGDVARLDAIRALLPVEDIDPRAEEVPL